MDWCHSWWPNWWADIIVFTALTKVFQLPLSLWCHVNSLKMVAVMPESIRIKTEYYGDSEQIGEKTAALFKREKYHPMLSLVPLAIQIVILMGFVKVIHAIADAEKGTLLGKIPVQDGGISWLMPLAAGAAACILGFCQNRINPLQREQSRVQQMTTNGISVAISLFLGCFVGMGVGLYWAASNLFSILVQLACNVIVTPRSRIDYPKLREAQRTLANLEDSLKRTTTPEERRREKADWKRFFSVANKHLVFYAESGGYYQYFESVIKWILENTSHGDIHYVTNDSKDAVFELAKTQPRLQAYYIGPVRLIPLMMKMDADMVVMTTPDLNQFHIDRSHVRKDVEYVYVNHGTGSHLMCLRKGALDHFDVICANGQFQVDEHRATERLYGLKPKKLLPTGYPFLDTLLASPPLPLPKAPVRIMVAPSYQQDNIFDSCLDSLIDALAGPDRIIVLRPHPQYVRRFPARMKAIETRFADRSDVEIEADFSKPSTMAQAHLLVSDWSDIAHEFAFQTKRPVLFVDTPMKVINPEWERIDLVPIVISFRNRLGISVAPSDISEKVPSIVADMLARPDAFAARIEAALRENFFNPGHAGEAVGRYIFQSLVSKQQAKKGK